MTKVVKYPIYPITFAYVNGIFIGLNFKLSVVLMICFAILGFFLLVYLHKKQQKYSFKSSLSLFNFLAIFLTFTSLGYVSYHFHNQKVEIENLSQTEFTIKVDEVLKPNAYSHRIYAKLLDHKDKPLILVSFSNQNEKPKEGSVYKLIGSIKEIPESRNLHDFSYKDYLAQKRIHYQIHSNQKVFKIGEQKDLLTFIDELRGFLINRFLDLGYDAKTNGFIEALLFGKKNNLDYDIYEQFKDLGILHVLAVSGMHVVVLFGTIRYSLRLFRIPNKLVNFVLIGFLVVFVLLAGLSGSVVRAALMCLMAMLGTALGSRKETANLMVGSMFLILLIEPNYLFDVGFQLSYLAVFSIVFCYPIIQPFFKTKNVVLNFFTEIIGVSIAAQIGVLPLSIFYFKQIPLLFLIGNIIAVPLTNLLLIGWFLQLIVSFISMNLASLITSVLSFIAKLCFHGIEIISTIFSNKLYLVHFNLLQTILLTCLVFCGFWYFYRKTASKIICILVLIVLSQGISIYRIIQTKKSSEMVLISDFNQLIFLNREGENLEFFATKDTLTNAVQNYKLYYGIEKIAFDSLPNSFELNNKKWLIVDSLGIYPKQHFEVVVLYQNPAIHPERLAKELKPCLVIFHSNNYQNKIDDWILYFDKLKIPYYDMRSKGAFVCDYNSEINCSGVL